MEKIYLIHFNDGMMETAVNIEHNVFRAADQGELDIIDITDPMAPTFYYDSVWRKIEVGFEKKSNTVQKTR